MNQLKGMSSIEISAVITYLFRTLPEKDFVDRIVELLGLSISNAVLLYYSLLGEDCYIHKMKDLDIFDFCEKVIMLFDVNTGIAEAIYYSLQNTNET